MRPLVITATIFTRGRRAEDGQLGRSPRMVKKLVPVAALSKNSLLSAR